MKWCATLKIIKPKVWTRKSFDVWLAIRKLIPLASYRCDEKEHIYVDKNGTIMIRRQGEPPEEKRFELANIDPTRPWSKRTLPAGFKIPDKILSIDGKTLMVNIDPDRYWSKRSI